MNKKSFLKILTLMLTGIILVSACKSKKEDNIIQEDEVLTKTIQNSAPEVKPRPAEDLSGKVQIITEEEFIAKITEIDNEKGFQYKGSTPAIVDFYANWCRPCIALGPVLERLGEKYKGQIIIYKVNVDKAQRLAAQFGIQSIPSLLFLKPNEQPKMMVGAPTQDELDKIINKALL